MNDEDDGVCAACGFVSVDRVHLDSIDDERRLTSGVMATLLVVPGQAFIFGERRRRGKICWSGSTGCLGGK